MNIFLNFQEGFFTVLVTSRHANFSRVLIFFALMANSKKKQVNIQELRVSFGSLQYKSVQIACSGAYHTSDRHSDLDQAGSSAGFVGQKRRKKIPS
jgi:hypothetical protein